MGSQSLIMTFILLSISFLTIQVNAQEKTYCNPVSDTVFCADPFVLHHDGRYYLYATSAGDGFKYWISEDLAHWEAKGYAVSDRPLGYWIKHKGNPILQKDIRIGVSGPGHNCIVKLPDHKEWSIVYHSHAYPGNPGADRVLNTDRLVFEVDRILSVIGPTRSPQALPSGTGKTLR